MTPQWMYNKRKNQMRTTQKLGSKYMRAKKFLFCFSAAVYRTQNTECWSQKATTTTNALNFSSSCAAYTHRRKTIWVSIILSDFQLAIVSVLVHFDNSAYNTNACKLLRVRFHKYFYSEFNILKVHEDEDKE